MNLMTNDICSSSSIIIKIHGKRYESYENPSIKKKKKKKNTVYTHIREHFLKQNFKID